MKKIFILASATFFCGQLMAQSARTAKKPVAAKSEQAQQAQVAIADQAKKAEAEAKVVPVAANTDAIPAVAIEVLPATNDAQLKAEALKKATKPAAVVTKD